MALDFADKLKNNDIQMLETDKYRAYNLLKRAFQDNLSIGLDIAEMLKMGLNVQQIENIFLQYLSKFEINLESFSYKQQKNGDVDFFCKFSEDFENVYS